MGWNLRIAAPLALLIAACAPVADPAHPALWEVTGPRGQKAWLFGTIHALEKPARWHSAKIDAALHETGLVLVEVKEVEDQTSLAAIFARLATSKGQPPLSSRVRPGLREELETVMAAHGLREGQFADTETWAAALTIARAESEDQKSEYGIDRAVLEAARGKPVAELEGAAEQLSLFDSLPEREQRDLLEAVVTDAGSLASEGADLEAAWREGDIATIARETEKGMLADPELREVLFTGRNRKWSLRIVRDMAAGKKPFVAVGAAHVAGPQGLPALLEAKGYTVVRVQ